LHTLPTRRSSDLHRNYPDIHKDRVQRKFIIGRKKDRKGQKLNAQPRIRCPKQFLPDGFLPFYSRSFLFFSFLFFQFLQPDSQLFPSPDGKDRTKREEKSRIKYGKRRCPHNHSSGNDKACQKVIDSSRHLCSHPDKIHVNCSSCRDTESRHHCIREQNKDAQGGASRKRDSRLSHCPVNQKADKGHMKPRDRQKMSNSVF